MGFPIWQPVVPAEKMMVHPEESVVKAIEGLKTGLTMALTIKQAQWQAEKLEMEKKQFALESQARSLDIASKQLALQEMQEKLESGLIDYEILQKQATLEQVLLGNALMKQQLEAQKILPAYNDKITTTYNTIQKLKDEETNPIVGYAKLKRLKKEHLDTLMANYNVLLSAKIPSLDPSKMFSDAEGMFRIPVEVVKTSETEGSFLPSLDAVAAIQMAKSSLAGTLPQTQDLSALSLNAQKTSATKSIQYLPVKDVILGALTGAENYKKALQTFLGIYGKEERDLILADLLPNETERKALSSMVFGEEPSGIPTTTTPQTQSPQILYPTLQKPAPQQASTYQSRFAENLAFIKSTDLKPAIDLNSKTITIEVPKGGLKALGYNETQISEISKRLKEFKDIGFTIDVQTAK